MAKITELDDVPEAILMEILSKLPVKSLLQLKSVCKNWYALINDPIFISIHYQNQSRKSQPFVHHHSPLTGDSDFCFLNPLETQSLIPYMCKDSIFSWQIIGPLNGLFLLYNHQGESAVFNPCTREFVMIAQDSCFCGSDSLCLYSLAFGFGVDPVCDEFKVVRVCDFWDNLAENWHNPIVSVYSLNRDCWTHFEDSNFRARTMVRPNCSTYLDGFWHWKSIDNRKVFEFDMRSERFGEIEMPDFFGSKQGDLGVYCGCVAMFLHDFVGGENLCVDIWGVDKREKSWSVMVRIGPFSSIGKPLGFGENGVVFLHNCMSKVGVAISGSNEIKVYEPMKGFLGCILGVFDYKESLVSIKKIINSRVNKSENRL